MKRTLLTILLILIALSIGTYYTYLTDKGFKNYVSSLLNHDVDSDSIPIIQEKPEQKSTTQYKKRELKKIKPDKFHKLDSFARKAPKQYEKDVETLAHYLITPAKSEMEKARVLFTWVATHVTYNADAFNSGNIEASPAGNVLLTKKAVCDGYSNLFKELCTAAGLESEKVSGYCKGYSYSLGKKIEEPNHAWNVVKIDGQWKLFDPTWASGYGTNKKGKLVHTNRFDPYWFDVKPKEFIFTHLPEESKWQMLTDTLTLNKYKALPYLPGEFFKLGFDSEKVFDDAVSGNIKDFVEVFTVDYPLKAVQVPYIRNLKKGQVIDFVIESDYVDFFILVDGDGWNFFKSEGNIFTLSRAPKGSKASLCLGISGASGFTTVAEYKITNQETETASVKN